MNPYPYLAGFLLLASLAVYAVWERGEAEHWHQQYSTLQASYNSAALVAQEQAKEKEKQDLANLQKQSQGAIEQAQSDKAKAQLAASTYARKLAQLSGKPNLDLPHQCANVTLPADLIP